MIIKNEIPDNKSDDDIEPTNKGAPSAASKQATSTKKPQHAFKSKKKEPQPKDEAVPETTQPDEQQRPTDDNDQANKAKPKPFLKRKTKTMQPAKINWKPKSRIDCWNGASKT